MNWTRIGCAVDFSPESRAAMEQAALLASRLGASLTLVHVDDRSGAPTTDATLSGPVSIAREALELERILGEWAEDATRLAGREVPFLLLTGDPATEIVRAASERPFDAVVLATHGRAEADRLRFGSVAQAVVRDARCSVTVFRR